MGLKETTLFWTVKKYKEKIQDYLFHLSQFEESSHFYDDTWRNSLIHFLKDKKTKTLMLKNDKKIRAEMIQKEKKKKISDKDWF